MTRLLRSLRMCFTAVATVAFLSAASRLAAQQMQYHFGGIACIESGLHGVKQLAGGGYVAVGEAETTTSGCAGPDAMVVVTNANGTTLWANTYQIGATSRATSVVEDALAPGQLIVCGTTTVSSCNAISSDIFIMRLLPSGAVANLRIYGSTNTDDEAWKILQATTGGCCSANIGDFVVAGSTRHPAATGPRDGYMLRVNGGLGLVWDRQYGTTTSDDYFYGVAEVPTNVPNSGDIVAVGGSDAVAPPQTDAFVVRVNGTTGGIGASPQNVAWIDIPLQSLNDEARSVVVLSNGSYQGDIVLAGFSNGTTSTSDEALVVELGPDPCTWVASLYFGDNAGAPDRAWDLVEDANPLSLNGDVMVTGFTNIAGFGGSDVFLQRVSVGPGMALTAGPAIYGGNGNDEGRSVSNATHNNTSETPGYIVNGITQSPSLIGADPGQLYLIKTNATLASFCNQSGAAFSGGPVTASPSCGSTSPTSIGNWCSQTTGMVPWSWGTQLCYAFPKTVIGGQGAEEKVVMAFNEGTVVVYPNPVQQGAELKLRFTMTTETDATISVNDMLGREAYNASFHISKSEHIVSVPTSALSAGAYMARVAIGGGSSTIRFVVLQK